MKYQALVVLVFLVVHLTVSLTTLGLVAQLEHQPEVTNLALTPLPTPVIDIPFAAYSFEDLHDVTFQPVRRTVLKALYPKDNKTMTLGAPIGQHCVILCVLPVNDSVGNGGSSSSSGKSEFSEYDVAAAAAGYGSNG